MMGTPDSPHTINVVAAVIERDGAFLVTRRLAGTHLEGRWEFPGGKCEPGERDEECLRRELDEELGLHTVVGPELLTTVHGYPERTVRLRFFHCAVDGEPQARLGQEIRWVPRADLASLEFPPADAELIRLLGTRCLP